MYSLPTQSLLTCLLKGANLQRFQKNIKSICNIIYNVKWTKTKVSIKTIEKNR